MIWLFLALYGFDWRRLALMMGGYGLAYTLLYIFNELTSRQGDK